MTRPQSLRKSSRTLLRFISYFSPVLRRQYRLVAASFFALFAETVLQILQPWPLKFVIDRVILPVPVAEQSRFPMIETLDTMTLITVSAIALVAIVGLRAAAAYFSTVGFASLGIRVLTEIRNKLFRHLQYLSLSFHTKARGGDLMLRMTSDVGMLKEMSVTALLPLLGSILTLAAMFGVMFWLHWQLALVSLAITPLFFLFAMKRSRQIQHVAREQRKREGAMAATAAESITGIKEIQALSLNEIFLNAFSIQSKKSSRQDVKVKRLQAGLERMVDVLIAVATALALWYGAILVLGNQLTPGELGVFLSYLGTAFRPIRDFARYSGRIAKASAACERVLEVLEHKPAVYDLPGAIEAPVFRGKVRFENVSFEYEPGRPVIRNANFTIEPGQRVAIMGSSGVGKSTLLGLILRLYDCTQGRITIDERDVRDYTLASLRRQITVVLQDNVLFAVSVRENISYGAPDATPEGIEAAARSANAHEFIKMLPNGYDTIIGERGVTLSKGQRQRIAVARTALRKAPILILDEPTSALDEENEHALIEALERLGNGCTTFLVTHNIDYARRSDLILYLEDGTVVEHGSHADLMKINGRYASSYRLGLAQGDD